MIERPDLLTVDETAALMTSLGYDIAPDTLRGWRRAWLKGEHKGPTPLLLTARRLRYERSNVVETVAEMLAAARRAASGEEWGA